MRQKGNGETQRDIGMVRTSKGKGKDRMEREEGHGGSRVSRQP